MAIQKRDEAAMDCLRTATGHDLTGKEHHVVARTSAGHLRLAQVGEAVAGVIQEGKAAGYHSSFGFAGILKCVAGAAITPGQSIMAGADGTVVPGSTNPFGVARDSAFSGELVPVVIDRT
jgi:hypothetical protein